MSNPSRNGGPFEDRTLLTTFRLSSFSKRNKDESGAVTVDFIVITAGIVVLGGIIVGLTRGGQEKIAGDINTSLSAVPVN